MTHERDLDRLLDAWFADGPTEAPDRVVDDVASRIHRQPQRSAWRLALTETDMNASLKPFLAIAAAIVIAFAGWLVLREPGGVAAPAPSPSPTVAPTASPTAAPEPTASATPAAFTCDDGTTTGCAGPLQAGTVSSVAFEPAFSLTLPEGWTNQLDIARTYSLYPGPHRFDMQVLSHLAIPDQNADCTAAATAGAGSTVADWVDFFTTHPGLTVSTQKPVTIGGYDGTMVQFRVADDWAERCPNSIGPSVVLFTDNGTPPTRSIWVDDHRVTAWIIDVNGETVIIRVDSGPSLNANDDDVLEVQPILDSMSFAPGS